MFLFCLFVVVVCASVRACPLRHCLCPDVPVNGCKLILTDSVGYLSERRRLIYLRMSYSSDKRSM